MSPTLRNILLTVALALVAGVAGAWICANYVVRTSDQSGHSLHQIVHHDLSLSRDQNARIEEIERDYGRRRQALEARIRAANRDLARVISSSDRYSPEVQAAVDRVHHAMGELQKLTIAHVFDMRAVLTPEQARRFDAEVSATLNRDER